MVDQVTYDILDTLAELHIPEGKHKTLYVDSREMWKELMISLLETKAIKMRVSVLTRCAISWEALLIQRISIQN
jgi:hypothetical protein